MDKLEEEEEEDVFGHDIFHEADSLATDDTDHPLPRVGSGLAAAAGSEVDQLQRVINPSLASIDDVSGEVLSCLDDPAKCISLFFLFMPFSKPSIDSVKNQIKRCRRILDNQIWPSDRPLGMSCSMYTEKKTTIINY